MACSRAKGTSFPMTEAAWSRRLSSAGRRSMRAARMACAVAGDLPRLRGLGYSVRPTLPDEDLGLDKRADALLQEERVPLSATNQGPPERLEGRIPAEQGCQQLLGTLGRQGIDAELEVVGLAAPAVLVLGSVVGEEQDTGGGQTLQ